MNLKFVYLSIALAISGQIQSALLPAGSQPSSGQTEASPDQLLAFLIQNGQGILNTLKKQLLEQWFQAAKSGNLEVVQSLISQVEINAQDEQGETALILAATRGHKSIVKFLLTAPSIKINLQNHSGETAFMLAVWLGHYEICQMLMHVPGLNVNIQDKYGFTALLYACDRRPPETEKIVKLLLFHKDISVNISNNIGSTALMLAAARFEETNVLEQLLLHPNIDVNAQNNVGGTALTNAILNGRENSVKLLLKVPNIDLNLKSASGCTALEFAKNLSYISPTYARIPALIENTIEKQAQDKKKQELKEWFQAAKSGNLKTIEKLAPTVNINAKNNLGHTALMLSAAQGHSRTVKFLLNMPFIDINAQSNTKNTALIEATSSEKYDIVRMLLGTPGINLNLQNERGSTAFMFACSYSERLMKLFSNLPTLDINIKNNAGFTALMFAARFGLTSVVKELLSWPNIDVNVQDINDLNALMLATMNGHQDIVELLLQVPNINLNAQDDQGHTAIMLSQSSRQRKIQRLIEDKIDLLKCSAAEAIEKQNPEALAAIIAQIGIETILNSEILENICPKKDQKKYIDFLLNKIKTKKDKVADETSLSKKRKLSDDKAITACHAQGCKEMNCTLYCAACKSIYYCSQECQKADWKNHKKHCKKKP